MKRKLLLCGMLAMMFAFAVPAYAFDETDESVEMTVYAATDDGFTYYKGPHSVSITGYTGDEKDIVVPSEIAGLPVNEIGSSAFKNSNIESIIIPESVTAINSNAFSGASKIVSVQLPQSLVKIGQSAFQNCSKYYDTG